MIETTETEIDVEQLMSEIRAAVAKREASGQSSLVGASIELHKLLSNIIEPPAESPLLPLLQLQPEFVPRADDHYHVNDLLQYHDQTFIWNAYRALLKREPDEQGLQSHLSRLRSGRHNKIDILASLRFSMEGKRKGVHVEGLARPALIRRLYRVPVAGYLLEMAVEIARLPNLVRGQRQFETHLIAQQQLLADHLNQLINRLTQLQSHFAASFQQDLSTLFEEQRTFALVQHQQVVGLFRAQRAIIRDVEQVRDRLDVSSFAQVPARFQPSLQSPPPIAPQSISNGKEREMDEFFVSFAEQLRGSRAEVKAGLRRYLPELESAEIRRGILDLGCGRGEWLELLREAKFQARGVETNHALALEARGRKLEVIEQDALAHLRSLPDISVSAITAFHLIEHLSFETLFALLAEIRRVLKPGGLLIFETPNPKNLTVAACNFYSDPTHQRPLFPETLHALVQHAGFEDVRLEYLNPVDDDESEVDSEQWPPALRGLFFGPRDFAVIGRKPLIAAGRFKLSRIEKENEQQGGSEAETDDQTEQINLTLRASATGYEYYARPETEDSIVFEAIVDNNEYDLPDQFEPSDVVIDIGAHIGGFSFAALERGAGHVSAYEAHPANYAIACQNLERFGERAVCHNRAVWRSDQPATMLYNNDLTDYEHTGGISVLWNTTGIPVDSISLDEILREASANFQSPIRLLKLHCEGSEYPILFTAKHLAIVKEICGEYHEIESEKIPDRARIKAATREFSRQGLKDFLESSGWAVEIEPHEQDERLGRFRAWRRKRIWQSGQD